MPLMLLRAGLNLELCGGAFAAARAAISCLEVTALAAGARTQLWASRASLCRLACFLLVCYWPLAARRIKQKQVVMAKGDLDIAHAIHGGNLAKHLGRRTAKRIIGKQPWPKKKTGGARQHPSGRRHAPISPRRPLSRAFPGHEDGSGSLRSDAH